MKRLAVFLVLGWSLSLSPTVRAQDNPDDQYLIIYALIQQADTFDNSGEPRRALDDYTRLKPAFKAFKRFSRIGAPRLSISAWIIWRKKSPR